MRILKISGLIVGVLIALFVATFGAVWIFNPFGQSIVVSDPTPHGQRITEDALIANFYPVAGPGKHPAILLLGGSEGGIGSGITNLAIALHEQNYAVMTVSYFGGPEQPKKLELIPLEQFDRALSWLKSQPGVEAQALAVIGVSKGAEAALLIATRHPELRGVIAAMPSSVAWQGVDPNILKQILTPPDGSWALGGEPIPFVPYVEEFPGGVLDLYVDSLAAASSQSEAFIPIETLDIPVLLICGELDTLWPSCDMARQIESRAIERQGPEVTVLAYNEAGHAGFGLALDTDHPSFDRLASLGGTAESNNAARLDSWLKSLDYLQAAFDKR